MIFYFPFNDWNSWGHRNLGAKITHSYIPTFPHGFGTFFPVIIAQTWLPEIDDIVIEVLWGGDELAALDGKVH